MLKYLLAETW